MFLSSNMEQNPLTTALPGLKSLWDISLGDPQITIAVLDGPVDQSHPCFNGAKLTQLPTLVSGEVNQGFASQHGTHVTSVIFGQPNSLVSGIAPGCRGLIVPVFMDGQAGGLAPCSQIDLARAITQAVEQGAHVINISGGQLTASGESDRLLTNAIHLCQENNVLIVAATGNEGCDCLHIPAAMESVLAVGAMDAQGHPIGFSNWGQAYQSQGILAPGENILGAKPGGGTIFRSGTSFATPIVSGIVGLLLSIQLQWEDKLNPYAIRDALLKSALPCNPNDGVECRRFLVGRLNIIGTQTTIFGKGGQNLSNENRIEQDIQPSEIGASQVDSPQSTENRLLLENEENAVGITTAEVTNTALAIPAMQMSENTSSKDAGNCNSCGGKSNLVYAIGKIGYDFVSEARRDSIVQDAIGVCGESWNSNNPRDVLANFEKQPWEAEAITWTLNQEETPIYAVRPMGPFAPKGYELLREFMEQQLDAKVERVSIAGVQAGSTTLQSGQNVPVIIPAIRGMYSWTTDALIKAVCGEQTGEEDERKTAGIRNFLDRIYYELRNLGITPQERAINHAATNAFQIAKVFERAAGESMELDSIGVEKSPLCRPDSECWDVKLIFFNPSHRSEQARKVYRFTVDVSDVVPVTVGTVRSWSMY